MSVNDTADQTDPEKDVSLLENEQPHPDQMKLPGGSHKTRKPSFKSRFKFGSLMKPLGVLVLIVLIGAGAYFGWKYFENKDSSPAETSQVSAPGEDQDTDPAEASELTEEYSSPELRLDFKHPSSWTVTEGAGGIRVESSDITYATTGGEEVEGNFRLYIRKGAREVDSKYIGRGVAIQPSEELIYTDPEPGQRKETNLSSFGLDNPDNFAFLMVAGNFSLKKNDTLGPDYGTEPDAYIIAGGYTSEDLSEDLATNKVPLDSYANSSAYLEALEIIKSLQLR